MIHLIHTLALNSQYNVAWTFFFLLKFYGRKLCRLVLDYENEIMHILPGQNDFLEVVLITFKCRMSLSSCMRIKCKCLHRL